VLVHAVSFCAILIYRAIISGGGGGNGTTTTTTSSSSSSSSSNIVPVKVKITCSLFTQAHWT